MKAHQCVIVDDEANGRAVIRSLIQLLRPEYEIVAECKSFEEAKIALHKYEPGIVFLDIILGDKTGFDLLESISDKNFHLIFTTAHAEYALKAFRYSAIDYLTKPIDPDELLAAIERIEKLDKRLDISHKIDALLYNRSQPQKLALHSAEGIQLVSLNEIVRCEAVNNYTLFHLKNKSPLLVTRTLKEFDEILQTDGFVRVHQSHLVNLQFVSRFLKIDGGTLEMEDGSQVEVSRRKKEALLALLAK